WQAFQGTVRRSAWSLDPKSRTLRAEIDLENPTGRLRPNMYAYATITLERPNVLTLPEAAVITQNRETFCFRLENGKAARTPLQVGLSDGQRIEVLKKRLPGDQERWEDLTGAEQIIVAPPVTLKDDQPVVVHEP